MHDKICERIAKVITALLFVVSVVLFTIVFVVRPMDRYSVTSRREVVPYSAEEIVIVSTPQLTTLVDKRENISTNTVMKKNLDAIVSDSVEDPIIGDEVTIDPTDLELLAKVIYQEAGMDRCCDECRRRVADVVLNRVADDRFPDTIEGVLTEVTASGLGAYGRYHWTGVVWPDRAYTESEYHAVERAYRIAEEVLSGKHSDLYGNGYIWQAEFGQGTDNIFHCNTYFGRG